MGFGIFKLSDLFSHMSFEHIGHEISLEPLLMTIVAGYVATNQSRNRKIFLSMLQKVGPYVFIPFFTLTGASLDLSVLLKSALLAVIITMLRMAAITAGSFVGGAIAKAPKKHTQWMSLSLITQAGVSLGLAGEVNFLFEDWGPAIATAIVAVIMLNQISGPILCKIAIKKVGEHGKAKSVDEDQGGKTALILGINGYSLALAERLKNAFWKVVICDTDESKFEHALKLNKDAPADPHVQDTHADATKKNHKKYYELDEERVPDQPQIVENSTINSDPPSNASTDMFAQPHKPTPPRTLPTQRSPIPPRKMPDQPQTFMEALKANFNVIKGLVTAEVDFSEEHEEVIHEIQTKLITEVDKTLSPGGDIALPQWNYRDLGAGLDLKHDVVVCMLPNESINILACTYFKDKLQFARVIGGVQSPTSVDMYIKAGAIPYYTFSASVSVLSQSVTTRRINVASFLAMVQPEADNFPHNLALLPHLLPPDITHDELEDIRMSHDALEPASLIDVDLDTGHPAPTQSPLQPNAGTSLRLDRLAGVVKESFVTTGARLRELRDPIGLVNRGVNQMNVVPDSQRDEYLDEIAALHDTRPLTTNPIWMDLLAAPNTEARRVDIELGGNGNERSTVRTNQSVFEEYHQMAPRSPKFEK